MADARQDGTEILASIVRESDRPRYYATLFAPEPIRGDLFALYAFAAEIARIPNQVSDPTLGEIRLQWWRDALEAGAGRTGESHGPVLGGVLRAIATHALPLAPFLALIEARSADLYSDPPPTMTDLEGRLGETQSALFQLAAIICGAKGPDTADVAGHAGIAYGLARGLSAFAAERARGRTVLPANLLAERGLKPTDVFAPELPREVFEVVSILLEHARRHLRLARLHSAAVSRSVRLAFLPLATVATLLARIERLGARLRDEKAEVPDLEMLIRITAARFPGPKRPIAEAT